MNNIENKKILLVICGGISAYKSLEIIRLLKKRGASVKTILTKSAKEFVTALSVASLSQEKVYDDLFSHENESEMDHISLSRWSDLILVAPTTANTISKLSTGSSDDLASTVILASNKNVFLVPAMNVRMWEHPSTKKNLQNLMNFGYQIIGPEIGDMACGEYGQGKMTEPTDIVSSIEQYFFNLKKNNNFKALVTAGPTHEYIDPVRYISNRSSGKQGHAIAKSLKKNGFETTLISGPTNLEPISEINQINVNSAEEMFNAILDCLPTDVAIFSAAVSDFKIKNKEKYKIKKKEGINLNLEKNIDILSHISKHNSLRPKLVIGFAAETNNLNEYAKKKLHEKNCDWIIANDVSDPTIGFDSDFNEVSIFYKNMKYEKIPKMKKSLLADSIVKKVISHLN
ncbi:MAG TPA: bifunctional phosphopantothenoylcysteine decarboxylase/phosphopantothenate--cysteine ligase CoaBC [Candidatus Pelagibacter bacterium]|jgi:phosphopantothenoylcysteine decarboxylase/phosphopantothenate--cysteine ligase|nr:bifunctional phosphopantothenoylcysteine decarboxylase/phosphopantothenate--cysteine ligase CoaBC [Candidatus Pelagibacter bacterium]|tara:strand:+ start:311 stop:1510 length:1200 start_codon:yes stop_codon:yes gene_type:complete